MTDESTISTSGEPTINDDASPTSVQPFATQRERAFPLLALLQLGTFWAVLAACVDGSQLTEAIRDGLQGSWDIAGIFEFRRPWATISLVAAAGGVGALIGVVIGFGQVHKWRGALIAALVGVLYGWTILAIYAAPAPPQRWLIGGAVLLLTTIGFRIRSV